MTATTPTILRSAIVSRDGRYRYHLHRRVPGGGDRVATFVMLNPSTADDRRDDPTIRRCLGFARAWGCGELHVVNLFGARATDPRALRGLDDPVGPGNRAWVLRAVDAAGSIGDPGGAGLVVCAWGNHGTYRDQDRAVLGWIGGRRDLLALGPTRLGNPRHPLYAPAGAELVPWPIAGT